METKDDRPGRVIEGNFPAHTRSSEDDLVPENSTLQTPVLDLLPRLAAGKPGIPQRETTISFVTRAGQVEIVVGALRFGGENGALRKWAERIVSACWAAEREKETTDHLECWHKTLRGETCELPPLWNRDKLVEQLGKATAISVTRGLYRLGLDVCQSQVIAEDLTGRKMKIGSCPADGGPRLQIGRLEGAFLIQRWRTQLAKHGLMPMALRERDKAAEIALELARQKQVDSRAKFFRFQRRRDGYEVWLWEGNHGQNMSARNRGDMKPKTRSEAEIWARNYAAEHGFAYSEAL